MLVGAGGAVIAAPALFAPQHEYAVSVFLKLDATAEQKAAVEEALSDVDDVDTVRFESREQAWKEFQEMAKDRQDLLAGGSASLPESFRLDIVAAAFDCESLDVLLSLPVVERVIVVQRPEDDEPGAKINCGNLLR